jgi:hypothetical protein
LGVVAAEPKSRAQALTSVLPDLTIPPGFGVVMVMAGIEPRVARPARREPEGPVFNWRRSK